MSREQETQRSAPQSQTQDPVGLISTRQKPTIPERTCTVSEEEPGASSEGIAPVGIEVPSMKRLNKMCYHFRIADQQ
ncbi:uncharacterized protein [Nothobranchius furzeri]|uniref:uncharacterized protein isoform X7 n=1 Tax=Nothobranchius furzeri TaxID=105023 RepID=UPI0039046BC3